MAPYESAAVAHLLWQIVCRLEPRWIFPVWRSMKSNIFLLFRDTINWGYSWSSDDKFVLKYISLGSFKIGQFFKSRWKLRCFFKTIKKKFNLFNLFSRSHSLRFCWKSTYLFVSWNEKIVPNFETCVFWDWSLFQILSDHKSEMFFWIRIEFDGTQVRHGGFVSRNNGKLPFAQCLKVATYHEWRKLGSFKFEVAKFTTFFWDVLHTFVLFEFIDDADLDLLFDGLFFV